MSENRIFSVEDNERGGMVVIDLEKVCAMATINSNAIEITLDNKSMRFDIGSNTSKRLFQQFIEYKTACPYTPPLKKPLPTSGTEIKAM